MKVRQSRFMAFYAPFPLTPILLLAIGVASYFFGMKAVHGQFIVQIESFIGPQGWQAPSRCSRTATIPDRR